MIPKYVLLNTEVLVKKLEEKGMDIDIFVDELFKADEMISIHFRDEYNVKEFKTNLKRGVNKILLHIKSLFLIAKIVEIEPESIVYDKLDKIKYTLSGSELEGCKKILYSYEDNNKISWFTFAEGEEDTIMKIWNNELLQFTICFKEKEVIDNIGGKEIYEELYNIISNNFIVLKNKLQSAYSIINGEILYKCYIKTEDFDFMNIVGIIDDALEELLRNKYNKSNEEIVNILLKGYKQGDDDMLYLIQ